jgi:hypothetical protein
MDIMKVGFSLYTFVPESGILNLVIGAVSGGFL